MAAPGFIDMLGQSELSILVNPHLPSKIFQGITTEITGEGNSIAPLTPRLLSIDRAGFEHYHIKPDWTTFAGYFSRLERQGIGINLASYVGATQARRLVLGDGDRTPSAAELGTDASHRPASHAGRRRGAFIGPAIRPAPYAKTDELIALPRKPRNSAASTQPICEAKAMPSTRRSMKRFASAAKRIFRSRSGISKPPANAIGAARDEIVQRIEKARAEGLDIAADTYAYPAWFNSFSAFIPPWAHDGGDVKLVERLKDPAMRSRIRAKCCRRAGGWDNEWQEIPGPEAILISVVSNPKLLSLQGKTIAQVAKARGKDPIDLIFDLLAEDPGMSVAVFGMSEQDVAYILKQPWVSIDNDSQGTATDGILGRQHPHPRAYGTFPRILRKYVREEKLFTLRDAIRKFSALPAQRMRLTDRGVLKQGMWADIVIFDPDKVRDLATFENPNQLSEGMQYVLVNGVPVIDSMRR